VHCMQMTTPALCFHPGKKSSKYMNSTRLLDESSLFCLEYVSTRCIDFCCLNDNGNFSVLKCRFSKVDVLPVEASPRAG
jgi:hypothetical protein